jgi:TRAP-type transport system periplasmic protein
MLSKMAKTKLLIWGPGVRIPPSAPRALAKHYRFAHDQQLNSGYSVAYDLFSARLKELSKGTMLVDQYPGAQLGQEPRSSS